MSSDIEQSANGGFLTAPSKVENFLNELEKSSQLHDVDKLVFLETVDSLQGEINETPGNQKIKKNLSTRLEEDLNALNEIRNIYDKEMSKILAHFETRGMAPTREKWDS